MFKPSDLGFAKRQQRHQTQATITWRIEQSRLLSRPLLYATPAPIPGEDALMYAPNGSGKTTLSTIFRSLKTRKSELIELKKTFGAEDPSEIVIETTDRVVTYDGQDWSDSFRELEVFDIHYS